MPAALHVTSPPQRACPPSCPTSRLQVSVLRDRLASCAQAASSTSVSPALDGALSAPARTLLSPLGLSVADPLSQIQELYSLALVAEPPVKPSNQKQEYHVQFGTALRTLREDMPLFFKRPQRMDIFSEEVVFNDAIGPRLGLGPGTVYGKSAYRRHLWALRLLAGLVFCHCEVDLQRFWQRSEQSVAVRWVMHGSPRLINAVVGTAVRLDGISEFKFNSKGLIYEHSVDCINWDGMRLGLREQSMRERIMRVAGIS